MKKNVFGRRLKRNTKQRKALFKSLLTSLVLHESIRTTEAKAKAIKRDADKLITKAKKGEESAKRHILSFIHPQAVEKLFKDVSPRFTKRQGGYTRIIRVGKRFNDNAQIVIIEWVEKKQEAAEKKEKTIEPKKEEKKPEKVKEAKKSQRKKKP